MLKKMNKIMLLPFVFFSVLVSQALSQQVFEGKQPARPSFNGQTRAPIAEMSPSFEVSEFVASLTRPWAMAHMPNGKMLVTEVPGRMRIIDDNGNVSAPIENVPMVRAWGSRGLNEVVLDPDFENNRMIYFNYLAAPDGTSGDNSDEAYAKSNAERAEWNKLSREEKMENPFGFWRIASARLSNDELKLEDVKIIIETVASRILFDDDGKLLITTQRKSPMGEQDLSKTLGMVIRINKDGTVPGDNPFMDSDDINKMAYVTGLRNSTGFAYNHTTGEFWAADQGPDAGDELNIIKPGHNYGWPGVTYGKFRDGRIIGDGISQKEGTMQPIYFWSPSLAPSSMMFYQGDMFPAWKGNLFLTGLSSRHVSRLVLSENRVTGEERLLDEMGSRLRHISEGINGEIYVLQDGPGAKILRITAPVEN